ncbi:uncharacterized protein LOC110436346 isoform X1 [Sorghum bicolor]|uniref:uncharacterized protein LOC110436346 isoform X1 n=1 Tax=Sorghum bicolor TaxID=4558 RepID=UPI000B426297|nr:uncharacterized protein LOC110436346 isoform X1 [Sorghum bicolor]|eukprot:XP_021318896.1 uncharacterized protein LOC110436346 isoform X1 [Sorghum bicolor]
MGKASLRPLCCLHHRGPPAVPSFRSAAMVLLLLAFAPWGRVPCPTMLHAAAGPTTCQCATTTPHNSRVACPALSYSVPPWVWVAVLLRDLSGRWRSLLLTSRALVLLYVSFGAVLPWSMELPSTRSGRGNNKDGGFSKHQCELTVRGLLIRWALGGM